ncbi:MAG TPA: hypothetical protein VLL05_03745, partial [Terriglobales bacterium]|nr:hypothetical protein [Terriglobales bacterium]
AQSRIERATSPFQYIRETVRPGSSQRQIFRAALAPHLVGLDFEVDLLTFGKAGKPGTLDGADVHEHIVSAIARRDKTKALLAIEPLNSTGRHIFLQSITRVTIHAL